MTGPDASAYHLPVMSAEVLQYLAPMPGQTMLDATLGGGGHSVLLAERLAPDGVLIGLDRDSEAIEASNTRLAPYRNRINIHIRHAEFGTLDRVLSEISEDPGIKVDGILFDLGVSSHQLDTDRGFSFRRTEALDMRMSRHSVPTAADLLVSLSVPELTRILHEFGDERFARRIAEAVAAKRATGELPATTAELAQLVERCVPRSAWPRDIHVATRTFQALRIAVNDELGQLRAGLAAAVNRLRPGGRVVVISFHSLEDRIVKQAFAGWSGRASAPSRLSPAALSVQEEAAPILSLLTRKPVQASQGEVAANPRSRSAKLRAAVRLP